MKFERQDSEPKTVRFEELEVGEFFTRPDSEGGLRIKTGVNAYYSWLDGVVGEYDYNSDNPFRVIRVNVGLAWQKAPGEEMHELNVDAPGLAEPEIVAFRDLEIGDWFRVAGGTDALRVKTREGTYFNPEARIPGEFSRRDKCCIRVDVDAKWRDKV